MIDRINKPLSSKTKMKKKKSKINKNRDEKGDMITNSMKSRIIRQYLENLYSNKLENLEEIDKFLDVLDLFYSI
jgi:hypothetical protein